MEEKTYYDGLIESNSQAEIEYENERAMKKELRRQREERIKVRKKALAKFYAKVALVGGLSLGVLFNGERIIHGVETMIDNAIEADNEAFEKEVQEHKDYVHQMTGKTTDEIMNGSVTNQALTDAYNAGYEEGLEKGKELRDLDKEMDTYDEEKDLSKYIEVDCLFESKQEEQTYKDGYSEGLSEGYTKGALTY